MKVLLWHGYLLRGSGSNIYAANVARALRANGHEVTLLCQERGVDGLDLVDEHGVVDGSGVTGLEPGGAIPSEGRCTLLRPDIGSLLPVYVWDHYEGFEAKRFVDLTDAELDHYVQRNVAALSSAIETTTPEVMIVGHEVMGPYITHLCDPPSGYAVQLHGSALEYAVKIQDRYRSYASAGLGAAKAIIGGSEYMIRAASSVITGWEERASVVNPGCDAGLFIPAVQREPTPTVGYVGKLIAAKGVHLLLAALGLTSIPGMRCIVVGYGGMEERLRSLASVLSSGDSAAIREVAADGVDGPLQDLLGWIDDGGLTPSVLSRLSEVEIMFTGPLGHDALSRVMPRFWALAVPSVVPEAFGMVAAEAAASGVLPVVPGHSGIGEAAAAVEAAIGAPGFLTYDPSDPIPGLAARLDAVLSMGAARRQEAGAQASVHARKAWDWPVVAEALLGAAR